MSDEDRGLDRVDDLLEEIAEEEKFYDRIWDESAPDDNRKDS